MLSSRHIYTAAYLQIEDMAELLSAVVMPYVCSSLSALMYDSKSACPK